MKLEDQLAALAGFGLRLNDGVTADDLIYSFGRDDLEKRPFSLLLFALGIQVEREPWGRDVCSRVWNFDTECINATGDYTRIVKRLCQVAGKPDCLANVSDFVDMASKTAWLKYEVDGAKRNWPIEVNNDWADTLTLSYVMDDIERDGKRFYFRDNGQAMILFYLDAATASALNTLSGGALKPVLGE